MRTEWTVSNTNIFETLLLAKNACQKLIDLLGQKELARVLFIFIHHLQKQFHCLWVEVCSRE